MKIVTMPEAIRPFRPIQITVETPAEALILLGVLGPTSETKALEEAVNDTNIEYRFGNKADAKDGKAIIWPLYSTLLEAVK